MITNDTPDQTPTSPVKRRNRKSKLDARQALVDAERMLRAALQAKEKALTEIERAKQAELARRGRMIYLRWIEGLHPAERDLHAGPAMQSLPNTDHAALQAWLTSLTR